MDPSNRVPSTAGTVWTWADNVATNTYVGPTNIHRYAGSMRWYLYDPSCAECAALRASCPSCQIAQRFADW